jgi:hypothetical protein
MRLESARDLKASLFEDLASGGNRAFATASPREPGLLLGISPGRSSGDFRLALRLTRADPTLQPAVQAARRFASDEVDVRLIGAVRPRSTRGRARPLLPGISIAHYKVTAGTLGGIVRDCDSGDALMLSNSHVLADSGMGAVGDAILHPGPADGGTDADRVGRLVRWAPFSGEGGPIVDAAVASLDDGFEITANYPVGELTHVAADVPPDGTVGKIGRTTGVTEGRVTAFELDHVPVEYDTGLVRFDQQIEVEGLDGPFSLGGDSGSLVYSVRDATAVGLLFAGSEHGGTTGHGLTYANPLPDVLRRLNVAWAS